MADSLAAYVISHDIMSIKDTFFFVHFAREFRSTAKCNLNSGWSFRRPTSGGFRAGSPQSHHEYGNAGKFFDHKSPLGTWIDTLVPLGPTSLLYIYIARGFRSSHESSTTGSESMEEDVN